MTDDSTLANRSYTVVVNHEEQYSIWPTGRAIPKGWTEAGLSGSKAECLEFVREAWKDMRPLSVRPRKAEG